jgi:O-antigen/teichoic acid export membrane protein
LQHEGEKLRDAFFGSARSLLLVVGPIAVLLTFASGDFLRLFSHGQWLPALPMVQVAVWASLLRGLGLLFPQLYHATGRPEYALYDSLVTGGTLVTGFVLALVLAPAGNGALWVAWAWLLSCPVALAVDFALVRRCAPITLTGLFRSLRRPAAGVALLVPVLALARFLRPTNGSPLISLLLLILLGLGTYALYLRRVLHLRPADLLPKR